VGLDRMRQPRRHGDVVSYDAWSPAESLLPLRGERRQVVVGRNVPHDVPHESPMTNTSPMTNLMDSQVCNPPAGTGRSRSTTRCAPTAPEPLHYFPLTAVSGAPDTPLIPGTRADLGCWGSGVGPVEGAGRPAARSPCGPQKQIPITSPTESSIALPSDLGQPPGEVEEEKKGDPTAHAAQTPRRL
jgi:hypothetical protein